MNEHTRNLLYDAKHEKFDDALNDLEYDDININASDNEGKTVLHSASMNKWASVLLKVLDNFDVNIDA